MECDEIMNTIKKYKWFIVFSMILLVIYLINKNTGQNALNLTFLNIKTMLSLVPPIFIIIGLLDVWVPKETMIKFMGGKSGLIGIAIAFLLGSVAAGPLYVAFPIAALLLKKGARFAYVLFFLGIWASAKLPIILYEYSSFGGKFTLYHIITSVTVYLLGSILIEKLLSKKVIDDIYLKSQSM